MMLLRVTVICLTIFSIVWTVLWMTSSTNYFNSARLKKILKYALISISTVVITAMVFFTIVNFDHLF